MLMRSTPVVLAAIFLAMPLANAASYAGGAIKTMKTDKGTVLTDSHGMTLYAFDKDTKGVSNCYGGCAVKWPPLEATASARAHGKYTLIKRKDGARQWAVSGKPLYLWQNDKRPGDTTGDGVLGVWHVARD